jgi:competence ComEA-like helix-hairpin-helix protein
MTLFRSLSRFAPLAALVVLLAAAPARADDQLNVNTATEEELEKLPGLGPALAKRIVDQRALNGPFESVDDLQKVKGMTPQVVDKLRAYVFVGSARPTTSAAITATKEGDADAAPGDVKKLLARYGDEPSIRDVQEAATRFAEVHPEVISSWRSRSRLAALGPSLRAEYRYVGQDNTRLKTGGDTADTKQTDLGIEHRPLVRAQWDLDRLVFNPDELRVSNEVTDLVRLRESVLDQVTKVYYERRRLQVDLDLTPPKDIAGRVRKELRLQELAADLDALTGGFFSKKLAERGLDPY